jgi:elongation factor G
VLTDTGNEEIRKPFINEPFCGFSFKIATDPYVGRLAFIRFTPEKLIVAPTFTMFRTGNKEKSAVSTRCMLNKQNPIEFCEPEIFVQL